jgi:hypothetical protein
MSRLRSLSAKTFLLLGIGMSFTANANALDTGGANDVTAVSGRTSKDYVRKRLADGSFAPESYAFGQGGNWSGAKWDASIDNMKFLNVAHIIAYPLANQNYLPSKDPKATKLLIMVYWGTTHAPEHASETADYSHLQEAEEKYNEVKMKIGFDPDKISPTRPNALADIAQEAVDSVTTAMAGVAAENHMRDKDDELNVMMLGYDSWWDETQKFKGTPLDFQRQDLLTEIEEDRYFVVLMAYDFQLVWKQKKHKLLWETRFSIRQRHHDFDKDLPSMAQFASQYFGQDSNGLVRKEIPMGHVDIGEVKSLGEADAPQK